ncbi:hypothetical protein FRB94_012187 [Tulasnella sp. JGI-2019a]|nr:hypothetical protein FRB94_012187 [Tulasnella sp. JGI-2019a]KAG9012740.1 hypothetical protein FRB93_001293 [Tulasnella sp. JGI-2019a]KAG9035226.1 hypothetical protein FRB95_011669 [Tulasnella sp. JGI-2019a]
MPQQTDSAKPVNIRYITDVLVGSKLRIAGRLLCYDHATSFMLLSHHPSSVLVDLSLCMNSAHNLSYLLEEQSQVMVIGLLDKSSEPLRPPILPPYSDAPKVDLTLVLRAIMVKEVPDLDLNIWNEGISALDS